jgi:hypothetical protein
VFGPSVCVILGLCTDLAQTRLGHGQLVKQNIHQSLVLVQIWLGSVKTSMAIIFLALGTDNRGQRGRYSINIVISKVSTIILNAIGIKVVIVLIVFIVKFGADEPGMGHVRRWLTLLGLTF